MATVNLSDEALLAFFQSHPSFRDRLVSIVGAVGNLDGELVEADAAEERLRAGIGGGGGKREGALVEADAAEERLVEEMRLLGREALQGWADQRVEATEREVRGQAGLHRPGKKNSAGTRNSVISRS